MNYSKEKLGEGDTTALELLKEEMQTDEIHLKVNAVHRLKIVILTLNNQVVDKLIPYLDSLIGTEDDEVLFAIAEELGATWQLLPSRDNYLPLLEKLAKSDETVVREQAARSLISIAHEMTEDEIASNFAPLVVRLAQADWFTGRVSSCWLFQHAYEHGGKEQDKLRKKFMELCQEDTPMIRRACAQKLGEFALKLPKQVIITELMPIFRQLSQDEQDTIRVMCLESLVHIATMLSKEENQVHTLNVLLKSSEDKSWKVRVCFAKQYPLFAKAFGEEITAATLVTNYCNLMSDPEPEVRNTAISSLHQSLKDRRMSVDTLCNRVFAILKQELPHAQASYKAGVVLALCEMAPQVGDDFTFEQIMPVLMEAMKEENTELHINIVQNLKKVWKLETPDKVPEKCKTKWPEFLELIFNPQNNPSGHPQWRVRVAATQLVSLMSVAVPLVEFKDKMDKYYWRYLTDKAASVRNEGCSYLEQLCKKFPQEYISNDLIPKFKKEYGAQQIPFHQRMTILESLSKVLIATRQNFNMDDVTKVLNIFKQALQDKVPNVVFCALKQLRELKCYDEYNEMFVKDFDPIVKPMVDHDDADVGYFATIYMQKVTPDQLITA
jgi:serine/threonine-protein phosphatase 2A regulatory subunit A